MANEITVPLLPCRDIDEIVEFELALDVILDGLERLREPARPNRGG